MGACVPAIFGFLLVGSRRAPSASVAFSVALPEGFHCRGVRGAWGAVKPVCTLPGMVPVMAFLRGFRTVCPRRIPEWGRGCWWLAGERGEVGCGGAFGRYLRVFVHGFPAGSIGLRRLFRRPHGGFSLPRSPRGMGSGQTGVRPSRDGPGDGLFAGFLDGLSPQNPGMGEGVLVAGGRKGRGGGVGASVPAIFGSLLVGSRRAPSASVAFSFAFPEGFHCRGVRGAWGLVKPVCTLPGMVPVMAFLRGFRTVCPCEMPGLGEGALAVAGGGGRAGVSWGR